MLIIKWFVFSRPGGIPARNHKGERLLIYLGIIDILQSYRMQKKLEHVIKSIIHDGVNRIMINYLQCWQGLFLLKKSIIMLYFYKLCRMHISAQDVCTFLILHCSFYCLAAKSCFYTQYNRYTVGWGAGAELWSRPATKLQILTYFLLLYPVVMSECWVFSEAMLKNFKKTDELFLFRLT